MSRVLLGLVAILALYFGFGWVRHALASDEELIRAQFDRMLDGVDHGHPGQILSGFDRDRYQDRTSGYDAEDVRSALLYLFLQQRVDLEAELDPTDGLTIRVDESADPPRAEVDFHFMVEEVLDASTRRPWWEVRGSGTLEKSGGDWRFVSSRDIDHSTRRRL